MRSETLGHNARQVVKRPVYAAIGGIIGVFSVTCLVYYWVAPHPELIPYVSTVIPVVVIAYLVVIFATAARTKQ